MAEIYVYQDPGCIAEAKVAHDVMGGTERFFVKWGEWLKGKGHLVEGHAGLPPSMKSYDICIHSNVVRDGIKAEKHVLWPEVGTLSATIRPISRYAFPIIFGRRRGGRTPWWSMLLSIVMFRRLSVVRRKGW